MNAKGFTLIEIVAWMAVSTLILGMLLTIPLNTTRTYIELNKYTDEINNRSVLVTTLLNEITKHKGINSLTEEGFNIGDLNYITSPEGLMVGSPINRLLYTGIIYMEKEPDSNYLDLYGTEDPEERKLLIRIPIKSGSYTK